MRLPCGIHLIQAGFLTGFCLLSVAGCAPPATQNYEPSEQVAKLKPEDQAKIQKILAKQTGSPTSPKFLGDRLMSAAHLKRGSEVYRQYCYQCHGVTGDGNGPQAQYLIPKPRDYRRGIFKFTSTTYGSKPLREDVHRTIRRGVLGTSMPSFDFLPPADLEAVTDYVLALTHRGELESLLADAVEFEGELNEGAVPGMVETIQGQWKEALANVVNPRTPMPLLTRADAEAGKKIFLSIGCNKCHGDEGRGEVADELPPDIWGNPIKAADITAGMLRGGTDPLDVYRRIEAGINGTPMPAFRSQFETNPEEVWKLVAYVMSVYDMRRDGITPPSAIIKPLPGVKSSETRQSE
jgi:mono/diheme cytochrome c family protein